MFDFVSLLKKLWRKCGLYNTVKCSSKRNNKLNCDFFHATIAYMKGNSKTKDKRFKKTLKQNKKNLFFGSKMGGRLIHGINLYTGKYGIVSKVNQKITVLTTYSVPVLSVKSLIFFPSFPMIAPTMLCGTRTLMHKWTRTDQSMSTIPWVMFFFYTLAPKLWTTVSHDLSSYTNNVVGIKGECQCCVLHS